jgi:integration host factor subunit alpha
MALTKNQIVDAIHEGLRFTFSRKQIIEAVDTLIEIIKKTLENGDDLLISGFGKFSVKEKKERQGRNPATGDDMILEPRRVVTFKCSGKLRNKLNGKPG